MGCITSCSSKQAEISSRRRRSPAAVVLDDDDLLLEILLRLPPQPSSLPRASAVCNRWRCLLSDPSFSRRFRTHHRRNPPLLGFYDGYGFSFLPTLESPNRVPPSFFSLKLYYKRGALAHLGSRHGFVLMLDHRQKQVLVWDPFTGDQHRIALPQGLDVRYTIRTSGAVLRAAGDFQYFQVVLVVAEADGRALACVYRSETGEWGNLVSAQLTSSTWSFTNMTAVLDGHSLYWRVNIGLSAEILEFDLERQRLAVILTPPGWHDMAPCDYTVTRAEGGGIGFLVVSHFCAKLWKRKADCDGILSWVLERTIDLDNLLSLNSRKRYFSVRGFAEDNNVVILWSTMGIFLIHLESLKFTNFENVSFLEYHPFESVYAAGI